MSMQELSPVQQNTAAPTRSFPWLAAAGLSAAAFFVASRLGGNLRRKPVQLRGKVALITGGSRGLGLALAKELGESGCALALVARDSAELDRAIHILRTSGLQATAFPCDITKKEELDAMVTSVLNQFGRVDVLVNDAGLISVGPLDSLQYEDFERAMDLMFWAPVNLTLALLPHMRRQRSGHIVNISSIGGRVSVPHLLPYCCAKFALTGFSTGLSSELDSDEVHVLTVIPGLLRTGSYLNGLFRGKSQQEFGWFGLLDSLPGLSVSAEEAAQEIRQSLELRQSTCTISLPAKLAIHGEALLPEATRAIMQLVAQRILPGPDGNRRGSRGKGLENKLGTLFKVLTSLGKHAAVNLNE